MSSGRPSSEYFIRCQISNVEAVQASIASRAGPMMVSEATAAHSLEVGSSPDAVSMLAAPCPLDLVGTLMSLAKLGCIALLLPLLLSLP
jgi:hypothetical protein